MATVDQIEVVMSADVSDYLAGTKAAIAASERAEKAIAASAVKITAAKTMEARAALDTATSAKNASAITIAAARGGLLAAQSAEKAARAALANVSAQQSEAAAFRASSAAVTAKIAANNALVVSENNVTAASRQATSSFSGIGAQFQDIGVTAAMGMNPLMIALQQGTQLSAQLQQSAKAGQSVWSALGTGIASVVNPISLVTIGLIAAGTAAIQYFGAIISEAGPASESLKEQNDRIREVADRWGEAVPALKAYVDQLDAAADAGNLDTAYDDAVARQFAALRDQIPELRAYMADARISIEQLGGSSQEVDALQSSFDELRKKVENGTASSADLENILSVLAVTTGSQTNPSMIAFAAAMQAVSTALASAANNARALSDERDRLTQYGPDATGFYATGEFVAEQERLNGLTADQLALENEIVRVKSQAKRDGATALTDAEALAIATDNLAASERRREEAKAAKGGAKSASEAERERQAVVDMIEQLEHEYNLLGMTNEQKAISNALRDAGAAATDDQRKQIEALISATLAEEEAIRSLDEMSKEWANTIQSATRGFIDDLIEGKSAAEAFGNVLSSIANKLIDVGLDNLFGSSGFNIAGMFGGARATGGPVSSGKSYLVGERGPEMFTPSSAGNITPNNQMGGSSSVVFSPVIDARGADVGAVARIERVLEKMKNEIVPTIRHEISIGPKKGRGR